MPHTFLPVLEAHRLTLSCSFLLTYKRRVLLIGSVVGRTAFTVLVENMSHCEVLSIVKKLIMWSEPVKKPQHKTGGPLGWFPFLLF